MIQTFKVKIENIEVRKVEEIELEINEKAYPRLQIYFDDENLDRLIFIDKKMDRKDLYARGTVGTLELTITTESQIKTNQSGKQYVGEKTKIEISDFIPKKEKK